MAADEAAIGATEVCASWCTQQVVPIQYDADHPDPGIRPMQTSTACGLSFLVVRQDSEGRKLGFGSTQEELSRDELVTALTIAKQNVVPAPMFFALPTPTPTPTPSHVLYDAQLLELPDDEMIQWASEALEGALTTFREAGSSRRLRIHGMVRCRQEHLVVGNSHGLLAGDTTTALLATLHTMLSSPPSQGSSRHSATHGDDFSTYDMGVEAAQRALQARHSITLGSGDYPVIFGPQAVAELVYDLLIPALSLDTVAVEASPWTKRRGQQVASALLTMADEGQLPGLLGSRMMTGEGLPTGTTTLLAEGRLEGFLADVYHAQQLASLVGSVVPRNGLRIATDGRSFAMRPGIFPTNVTLSSPQTMPLDDLLAPIAQGIYVGGLWGTSPQGRRYTGAFTSTVIGPSFVIQQGKLAQPIQPGTLHLQDNFLDMLWRLTGLSLARQPIVPATGQSVVLAPEMRYRYGRFTS